MMATGRLTEEQMRTYNQKSYNYGLGMRVAKEGSGRYDFGWGGAAGAYLAVDPVNDLTIFYAQHVILSPNQGARPKIYGTLLEELGHGADGAEFTQRNDLTY
jgi:CubicO group peptidase (beta-lactamase class C family)